MITRTVVISFLLLCSSMLYTVSSQDPLGYYELLGVEPDASESIIRAAYIREAERWHPNNQWFSSEEVTSKFKECNDAYTLLSDPVRREMYDKQFDNELGSWSSIFAGAVVIGVILYALIEKNSSYASADR